MRGRTLRWLAFCCLLVAGVTMAHRATAEYFRVSPGPLNQGHAAYDNSEGCSQCHESAQGVTNQKCLACHAAVQHAGGLHTTFGGRRCIDCHTEHKGKNYNIIDWKSVGGRDSFKHDLVRFSLTHHHAQVACTQCHVRRLKTGRVSYLGLSRDCQSCHRGVHGFKRPELAKKCETCHEPGRKIQGWVLQDWKAHGTYSGRVLDGKHVRQPCTKCHQGGNMGGRAAPRTCVDCHTPSHPVVSQTANCASCHPTQGTFKGATVNHKSFGFPLEGKHKRVSCRSCHGRSSKTAAAGRRAARTCLDCHAASHPVTAQTTNCVRCHVAGGSWRGATIDHAKLGFPLLGKHAKLRCRSCHKPRAKLDYREGACTSCHTHRKAHQGQFADKPCASCHVEGGKRTKPFDHNVDTRVPLIGFHAPLNVRSQCVRCHPGKIYRTGKTGCVDCHQDKHKGELGNDCSKCHTPLLRFNASRSKNFEHTRFPLEGKHKVIACVSCHPGGRYRIGKHQCVDCHKKDDVHRGRLGNDCGKCHLPTKGAPKFKHDRMTRFPLTGGHRNKACALCHQPRPKRPAPLTVAQWRAATPPALDRTFPVRGVRCIDCHTDPHNGYVGTKCGECHSASSFQKVAGARARAVRPRDHRGVWLRLHATLPTNDGELGAERRSCAVCHGAPSCRHCHRTRAPRSHTGLWRLKTHGSAASFDPAPCRVCHESWSCVQCHRRTAPLSHRGAWRTAHGYAAGGFANDNCFVCHRRAYCARCHPPR